MKDELLYVPYHTLQVSDGVCWMPSDMSAESRNNADARIAKYIEQADRFMSLHNQHLVSSIPVLAPLVKAIINGCETLRLVSAEACMRADEPSMSALADLLLEEGHEREFEIAAKFAEKLRYVDTQPINPFPAIPKRISSKTFIDIMNKAFPMFYFHSISIDQPYFFDRYTLSVWRGYISGSRVSDVLCLLNAARRVSYLA